MVDKILNWKAPKESGIKELEIFKKSGGYGVKYYGDVVIEPVYKEIIINRDSSFFGCIKGKNTFKVFNKEFKPVFEQTYPAEIILYVCGNGFSFKFKDGKELHRSEDEIDDIPYWRIYEQSYYYFSVESQSIVKSGKYAYTVTKWTSFSQHNADTKDKIYNLMKNILNKGHYMYEPSTKYGRNKEDLHRKICE
jgi:hypothetical protein